MRFLYSGLLDGNRFQVVLDNKPYVKQFRQLNKIFLLFMNKKVKGKQ